MNNECEYCSGKKSLIKEENLSCEFDITIENNFEVYYIYNYCEWFNDHSECYYKINYCPMCGRKLG